MIEQRLAQKLLQHSLTICLAESCTGGLIAKRLTDQAGSSAYVVGGVVAYANSVKQHVLGVSRDTLETFGAVSAETALEMAEGARRLLGADIALSITGIAGPGGGSPTKPVGLTYMGLATPTPPTQTFRYVWAGDRETVRMHSATQALQLVLDWLETLEQPL